MQRRQRRQLNQKVRIQSANDELNTLESPVSAPVAQVVVAEVQEEVKLLPQITAQTDDDSANERTTNNENGMPRRSVVHHVIYVLVVNAVAVIVMNVTRHNRPCLWQGLCLTRNGIR